MVTLKNSQPLQIGTSLVSRRPSRSCKIFKRPKNREDSSDFDDFLMKTIATTRICFSKIFVSSKFSRDRSETEISARPIRDRRPDRTGPVFGTDPTDRTNIDVHTYVVRRRGGGCKNCLNTMFVRSVGSVPKTGPVRSGLRSRIGLALI